MECNVREDSTCAGDCVAASDCTVNENCSFDNTKCSLSGECGCCTCQYGCDITDACQDFETEGNYEYTTCLQGAASLQDCQDHCEEENLQWSAFSTSCGNQSSTDCACCACSAFAPQISGTCGNSVVEIGEQCDDGNTNDGDGCTAHCFVEACPQVIVQSGTNSKNCSTAPMTSVVQQTSICYDFEDESVKIDCELEELSLYNQGGCLGESIASLDMQLCVLSEGIFSHSGEISWYTTQHCYGACIEPPVSVESIQQQNIQHEGIAAVENAPFGKDGNIILAVLFVIFILILMLSLAVWWNSKRGTGYEEMTADGSIYQQISSLRPNSEDDDLMEIDPSDLQSFLKRDKQF
jgi:cysteine-rich repeat protein